MQRTFRRQLSRVEHQQKRWSSRDPFYGQDERETRGLGWTTRRLSPGDTAGGPGCQQRGRVLSGPDGLAPRPQSSQVAEMIFYLEGEGKRCVFRDSACPNGKGRIEPLGEWILHINSAGRLLRLRPCLCGSTGWPSHLGPAPRVPMAGSHPPALLAHLCP